MEMKDPKMMAIGTSVFALVNFWWIYLYTLVGLKFQDAFNPMIFMNYISNYGALFMIILVGALMALSIFLVRLFSNYLSVYERAIMGVAGVMVPVILLMGLFTNVAMFFVIMLFYMAGCIFFANTKGEDGLFARMKSGMDDSRKVITVVALGALLMSMLYVYGNYEDSKAKFKEAMVKVQSNINIGELLTEDDVRQMLISQELTLDEMRELTISQFVSTLGKTREELLSDPAMVELIDETAENAYNAQTTNRDANVALYYEKLKDSSSMNLAPIMEKMFEKPPLKYLFDFLPILVAVLVASMVSFFGMVIVSPVGAVLGMFVPAKPAQPKPPVQKQ